MIVSDHSKRNRRPMSELTVKINDTLSLLQRTIDVAEDTDLEFNQVSTLRRIAHQIHFRLEKKGRENAQNPAQSPDC